MLSLIFCLALVHSFETFNLRSSNFDKLNAYLASEQAQGELNLFGYYGLTIDLEIGTPSQRVGLSLGTNLSLLVVPSTELRSSKNNYFNASQSSSYKLVNSTTIDNQQFGFIGDISTETVKLNGVVASDQEFILASGSAFGDIDGNGGYLGLGLNQYEFETPNLVETFKAQGSISSSVFAIDINNKTFSIGGYNEGAYANLQKTDLSLVSNNTGWELQLDSLSVKGEKLFDNTSRLFFSIENHGIIAPHEVYSQIVKKLINEKDCYYEFMYTCKCDKNKYENFDDIDLVVGGKNLKITPKNYLIYSNSACLIDVSSSGTDNWVIGYPLLAEYATVFDIDQKSVTLFRYADGSSSKLLYFLIGGIALAVLIALAVIIIIVVRRKRIIENDQTHGTSSYNRINS